MIQSMAAMIVINAAISAITVIYCASAVRHCNRIVGAALSCLKSSIAVCEGVTKFVKDVQENKK